jgi:stage II sporulation protein P
MKKNSIVRARVLLGVVLVVWGGVFSGVSFGGEGCEVEVGVFEEVRVEVGEVVILAHYDVEVQREERVRPRFEVTAEERARLGDFGYLTRNIFLADPRTRLLESDIDVEAFLDMDFSIEVKGGPQVLIVHAHSMEMFADSVPGDPFTGVFGVGRRLAEILENEHGLEVLHYLGRFDVVDGMPNRQGSYERLEPAVRRLLADNPTIQVVIDLHRDGVGPHVAPMVTYVNGERAAQIMFVNGLSRRFRNGAIMTVYHLPNPYQRENLAFSLNLQLAANQLYPGLARRIYLLEFRYSLHMAPRSMLLEVGAQNNTFQEALNAMPPVANIIAAVVLCNY